MGTSGSYGGPKWPTSSDAVNNAASAGHPTPAAVAAAVRAFASDYAASRKSGSGGGGGGYGGGGGGGGGGGKGGGSSGRAARTGARLAQFLGTTQERGLGEALKELHLEGHGDDSLEDLCDVLLEALTEPGGLLDDPALREAMNRTLEELCKGAKTAADLERLLTGKSVSIEKIVATYYAHALVVNFEIKEFHRIRERVNDQTQAREFLNQAREYIRGFVEYRLASSVDLTKYNLNSARGVEMAGALNLEVIEAIGFDV